jgi:hypothetical protein
MDDYISLYKCIDCKTHRYLIFPDGKESYIICSACFRIRQLKKEEINKY